MVVARSGDAGLSWLDVGPASQMLAQHLASLGSYLVSDGEKSSDEAEGVHMRMTGTATWTANRFSCPLIKSLRVDVPLFARSLPLPRHFYNKHMYLHNKTKIEALDPVLRNFQLTKMKFYFHNAMSLTTYEK